MMAKVSIATLEMRIDYTLALSLFLFLVIVQCSDTDLKAKNTSEAGLGRKIPLLSSNENDLTKKSGGLDSDLDSEKGKKLKRGSVRSSDSKVVDQKGALDKSNGIKPEGDKAADVDNSSAKDGHKADKGSESKVVAELGNSPPTAKENVGAEQCEPSSECTADNKTWVACLRVLGDESPGRALLIQNKGKGSLSVKITSPDFVHLEETKFELEEKRNKKVMVSIGKGEKERFITLNAGNENCTLDLRDFMARDAVTDAASLSGHPPFLVFVFLAAFLVIALALLFFTLRSRFSRSRSKYQKLETGLPITAQAQTGTNRNDGWEDSWSDGWDDAEAPKTLSMPIAPTLSFKGISSRRVNKDNWKN